MDRPEGRPVTAPVAEIAGVGKTFGGLHALLDVSFTVEPGEILGIIGPNGAGKTALINTITGFYRADTGSIRFGGRDITRLSMHGIGRLGIARSFQNIRLFQRMSALENVMTASQAYARAPFRALFSIGRRKAEIERALGFLDAVELADKADLQASALSYGDARRLEIARALATEPHLLLLDEPAAGMNERESAALVQDIARLRARIDAIVLIEHDMSVVRALADRLLALDAGRLIASGTPAAVLRHPRVIQAYLGEDEDEKEGDALVGDS